MLPLIDSDIIRYELGACGQYLNDEGELIIRDFEFVSNLIDDKINEICEHVWADEEPILFLTSCRTTHKILHRNKDVPYKPNFREEVAVTKPYKGTRKVEKPFHYANITAYLLANYNCVVAEGLEADDMLAIYQTNYNTGKWHNGNGAPVESIICSRDKDLRMVEGNHYSWAVGPQPAFGPEKVDSIGYLKPKYKDDKLKKVFGVGLSFFCYQLLVGDSVDNIPGIPRVGPVKALKALEGLTTYEDQLKAVRDAYRAFYGDEWPTRLLEQARLLWMVTELEGGEPVMWKIPQELFKDE